MRWAHCEYATFAWLLGSGNCEVSCVSPTSTPVFSNGIRRRAVKEIKSSELGSGGSPVASLTAIFWLFFLTFGKLLYLSLLRYLPVYFFLLFLFFLLILFYLLHVLPLHHLGNSYHTPTYPSYILKRIKLYKKWKMMKSLKRWYTVF